MLQRPIRRSHPGPTRAQAVLTVLLVLAATLVPFTGTARAATATRVFNYTVGTQTFTVPDGVTSITVTMTGGKGGKGGRDTWGEPAPGGYRGIVTGSIDVTPGQVLTIAVGKGGVTQFAEYEVSAGDRVIPVVALDRI